MGNIVSIERVKEYLRIPTTDAFCDEDVRLQAILSGVEDQVQNYLGDTLLLETASLTQKFGLAQGVWLTNVRPIVSVQSILDPAANEIKSDRFIVVGELGEIWFRGFNQIAVNSTGATERWELTYTAGQFKTENQIPGSIQLAILMLAARRYQRPEPGIQAMRTLSQSTSYIPNPSNQLMPHEVVELLHPHVRRGV